MNRIRQLAANPASAPIRRWASTGSMLAIGTVTATIFYQTLDQNNGMGEDEKPFFRLLSPFFSRIIQNEAQQQQQQQYRQNSTITTPSQQTNQFTRAQVKQHNNKSTGIWVTYGQSVYDITEFIQQHPGGDKILLAAGGPVEPYWRVYTIHDSEAVREILAKYKIGELDPTDKSELATVTTSAATGDDPFANDPERSPLLAVRSQRPFNAETPPQLLAGEFLTRNELFYKRSHLPIPRISATDLPDYQVVIGVEDSIDASKSLQSTGANANASTNERKEAAIRERLRLSFADLERNSTASVTATLQCAGNRRADMKVAGTVQGLSWDLGAIGNAKWTGVPLRDLLQQAGISADDDNSSSSESRNNQRHIVFEGRDGYGASVPLETALSEKSQILLATKMNDEPLLPDHGYPVRVIIPGTAGARSVKWVHRIYLSPEESKSHWQRQDYKGFNPSTDWDHVDYSQSESIQEMPVQSAILSPVNGQTVDCDDGDDGGAVVEMSGYAWSGGGRRIIRVDVSPDGGKTWQVAELGEGSEQPNGRAWAWTQWSATVRWPSGSSDEKTETQLICKAIDSSYNVQPDSFSGIYNRRGVLSNAWHRINIRRNCNATK